MQITPCFRHHATLPGDDPNWQSLADDLATIIDDFSGTAVGRTREVTVKLYEIGQPKPNRPKATAVKNTGLSAEAESPRELSCCLSFYGGRNAPRERGRLYIPQCMFQGSSAIGVRPSPTQRTKVGTLAPAFAGLGGANVDWIVWSPTNNSATQVSHWFVDDEWDVIRKRGLKTSARTVGTTSG